MSIDLALSGGGIKGIAHIGVIKQLEEKNIKIESISGCSSGSIVAVLKAVGYSADEIYTFVKQYIGIIKKNMMSFNIFSINKKMLGINNGEIIEQIINNLCRNKGVLDITDIKLPIFIPTVDIISGKLIYFTNTKDIRKRDFIDDVEYIYGGNIGEIVRASCSFPGLFVPKKYNNSLLVDGGLREVVPTIPFNNNKVLAVSFNNTKDRYIHNIIDILIQSFDIMSHDIKYESIKNIQYNLEIDLFNVKLLDYKKINYIYKEGYNQAKIYFDNNLI